jgi:peptidyl-prolyl cis-trans isomerase C
MAFPPCRKERRPRTPDLFEPAHILFKAKQEDSLAYRKALAQAEAVLAELVKHPDCFEALARSLSDCPSATEGGRLGQVARGDTTPEFETFLVALAPRQLCPTCPALASVGGRCARKRQWIESEQMFA